jgi:hypothetical protein
MPYIKQDKKYNEHKKKGREKKDNSPPPPKNPPTTFNALPTKQYREN